MSAKATTQKISLALLLDNGTTTTGETKTISQTLGSINKDNWDVTKAYEICTLCSPLLSKSIYAIEQTVKNYLVEE